MTTTLATADLAHCVAIIKQNFEAYYLVGQALERIRDGELYKQTHDTFEAFCQQHWDVGRNYANKQIAASRVCARLGTIVPKPATETQARELNRLEEQYQSGVWQGVVDECKKEGMAITAARVKAAVDTLIDDTRATRPTQAEPAPDDGWTAARAVNATKTAIQRITKKTPKQHWPAIREVIGELCEAMVTLEAGEAE